MRILFLNLTIQTSTNDWLELLESEIQAAAVVFFFLLTLPKHLTLCPTKLRLENCKPGCLPCEMDTDYLTNCMQYVCSEWCIFKSLSMSFPVAMVCPGTPSFPIYINRINGIAELPLSPESQLTGYVKVC